MVPAVSVPPASSSYLGFCKVNNLTKNRSNFCEQTGLLHAFLALQLFELQHLKICKAVIFDFGKGKIFPQNYQANCFEQKELLRAFLAFKLDKFVFNVQYILCHFKYANQVILYFNYSMLVAFRVLIQCLPNTRQMLTVS